MAKKNKIKISCDSCEQEFLLTYSGKARPECCPFCGEDVKYKDTLEDDDDLIDDFLAPEESEGDEY